MNRRSVLTAAAAIGASGALATVFETLLPELDKWETWVLYSAATPISTNGGEFIYHEDEETLQATLLRLAERGLVRPWTPTELEKCAIDPTAERWLATDAGKAALERAGYDLSA